MSFPWILNIKGPHTHGGPHAHGRPHTQGGPHTCSGAHANEYPMNQDISIFVSPASHVS